MSCTKTKVPLRQSYVTLDELDCPVYVTLDELDCPVLKLRFPCLRHIWP